METPLDQAAAKRPQERAKDTLQVTMCQLLLCHLQAAQRQQEGDLQPGEAR